MVGISRPAVGHLGILPGLAPGIRADTSRTPSATARMAARSLCPIRGEVPRLGRRSRTLWAGGEPRPWGKERRSVYRGTAAKANQAGLSAAPRPSRSLAGRGWPILQPPRYAARPVLARDSGGARGSCPGGVAGDVDGRLDPTPLSTDSAQPAARRGTAWCARSVLPKPAWWSRFVHGWRSLAALRPASFRRGDRRGAALVSLRRSAS